SSSRSSRSASPPGEGAAAPISKLSKLALKDAILELEVAARRTRDATSSAALQLWQTAERGLGREVEIDDPAIRSLFSLHILAVEDLLSQVRTQVAATLEAVMLWGRPQAFQVSAGLKLLSDSDCGDNSALGQTIAGDLADADKATSEAQGRLLERLRLEVVVPTDLRLHAHEQLRELLRQRQRTRSFGLSARQDVASLRKGEVVSGL
ncbi:unnamed protein product, partial [Polarella glacialis]